MNTSAADRPPLLRFLLLFVGLLAVATGLAAFSSGPESSPSPASTSSVDVSPHGPSHSTAAVAR